jgi:hypothetical protein
MSGSEQLHIREVFKGSILMAIAPLTLPGTGPSTGITSTASTSLAVPSPASAITSLFNPAAISEKFTKETISKALGELSNGLSKKIKDLGSKDANHPHLTNTTLMHEYLQHWNTVVTESYGGKSKEQYIKRMQIIEQRLTNQTESDTSGHLSTKQKCFNEFRDHIFRIAANIKTANEDPRRPSGAILDLEKVSKRITDSLPAIFGPGHEAKQNSELARAKIVAEAAKEAGFSENALIKAVAIAMAESGGKSKLVYRGRSGHSEHSMGLFQVNTKAHDVRDYGLANKSELLDPLKNAKAAYEISNHGKNFSPWSTYKDGKFEKYMKLAKKAVSEITT